MPALPVYSASECRSYCQENDPFFVALFRGRSGCRVLGCGWCGGFDVVQERVSTGSNGMTPYSFDGEPAGLRRRARCSRSVASLQSLNSDRCVETGCLHWIIETGSKPGAYDLEQLAIWTADKEQGDCRGDGFRNKRLVLRQPARKTGGC